MNKSARKLYWLGNIAKTRIIDEILRLHADRDDKIVVFDYGCGDGGDWPAILGDNQRIELIGFEPSEQGYCFASERLRGFNSRILTGDAIDTLALQADFIVSFSVFEHVVDKREYLRHAKRLLARDGTCYLNYDDGHFRNILDLSVRETWMPAIRSRLRTLISHHGITWPAG
jgi:SAM-dependent methyltransferase